MPRRTVDVKSLNVRGRGALLTALVLVLAACTVSEPKPDPSISVTSGATPTPAAVDPNRPAACVDAKLLWADALETLLLVNCFDQSDLASVETIWAWDGEGWELLSADGPPAHVVTGFGWDADRDVLVRYGGIPLPEQTCSTDTWEWDMTEWHQIEAAPPTSCDHVELAWDGEDGRMILVGGGRGQELDATTWAWDGSLWTQVADGGPTPRAHHAMVGAYGTIPGGRPLFHGGFDGNEVFGDAWVWTGSAWEEAAWEPPAAPPSARSHHGMALGAPGPLIFGGATSPSTFDSLVDETWFYEFYGWRQVGMEDPHPSARGLPALGWDVVREVFVLYGGFGPDGASLDDTWEFDDLAWRCIDRC